MDVTVAPGASVCEVAPIDAGADAGRWPHRARPARAQSRSGEPHAPLPARPPRGARRHGSWRSRSWLPRRVSRTCSRRQRRSSSPSSSTREGRDHETLRVAGHAARARLMRSGSGFPRFDHGSGNHLAQGLRPDLRAHRLCRACIGRVHRAVIFVLAATLLACSGDGNGQQRRDRDRCCDRRRARVAERAARHDGGGPGRADRARWRRTTTPPVPSGWRRSSTSTAGRRSTSSARTDRRRHG